MIITKTSVIRVTVNLIVKLKRSVMVDHHASFTLRMMNLKTLALGPKSIWPFDINVVIEIT